MHAILRPTSAAPAASHRLSFSDLELDDETREVRRGSRRIELSPTEFSLLRYLLLNRRKVLSKAQILDHVWSTTSGVTGGSSRPTSATCAKKSIARGLH